MYFLWKSDWLSTAAEGVMGAIVKGIRTLSFSLSTYIYRLVINLYNLFEALCTARMLNNDLMNALAKRIGIILGLVMLLNIIFSFIKMMIEPDTVEDKEKGAIAIVKKVLLVIVMLGLSNFVFNTLYHVQRIVIKDHIISNILLPYKISSINDSDGTENFGRVLSEELIHSFYQLENFENVEEMAGANKNTYDYCSNMVTAFRNQILYQGNFDLGYNCLNESVTANIKSGGAAGIEENQEIFVIFFNWPLCVLVGILVVYFLFMYCLKVGVRMVQLMFLEIISPMAIVSYLSPKKDTMFSKWSKIYISTYIDVFIRMAIINFIIFLIATMFAADKENGFVFWESVGVTDNTSTSVKAFFVVVIVLALLTFAKKAPDLLKELLPASASKLGLGTSMKDIVGLDKVAKKGIGIGTGIIGGAAGGAAIGLLGGGLGGFAGGLLKGSLSGLKGQGIGKTAACAWKNQVASNKRLKDWRAAGGTNPFGRWGTAFNQWRGADTTADKFDRNKEDIEQENAAYNKFAGYFDAAKKRAQGKITDGDLSKLEQGSDAYLAAQQALEAKNKVELLKASAANLDVNDAHYQDKLNALNQQISQATTNATNAMDSAVEYYINDSTDPVIANNMSEAQAVINDNRNYDYAGFRGATVTNFSTFKSANDNAKTQVSNNNIELSRNASEGKAARANAKYSGRGK